MKETKCYMCDEQNQFAIGDGDLCDTCYDAEIDFLMSAT